MARSLLDEVAEILRGSGLLVAAGDGFHAFADFFDRATAVLVAKVQVQCPGRDQCGDVRSVAIREQTGDEIREAVQEVRASMAA